MLSFLCKKNIVPLLFRKPARSQKSLKFNTLVKGVIRKMQRAYRNLNKFNEYCSLWMIRQNYAYLAFIQCNGHPDIAHCDMYIHTLLLQKKSGFIFIAWIGLIYPPLFYSISFYIYILLICCL